MPRLFWKTFYWCHKVLPNRTILGIIAILIFLNISMVVYRPRSEVLEVITQSQMKFQTPKSSTTRKVSSSTTNKNYDYSGDDWHTFNISGVHIHVYSAYYDDRNKGEEVIRMNGAIKGVATGFTKKTNCLIETKHKGHFVKTIVRVEFLKEHFRLPWISSFIFCKLSEQDKAQASDFLRVSLVSINETSMPKNSLPIHQFPPKNQTQKLAVCVKPFHFQFNRALWLIEFIEMYRIQGAEHFIFYNHTLGPDVEKAIKYYIKLGIVSLLNWNLPLRSQKDIRTEAMFTAINDCNLRAVNRFEMVAMVDIDEFIMPQKAPNLTALLQPHLSKKFGSFNFRNVFHYLYWENNTDTLTKFYAKNTSLPYLLTQMKLRRVVVSQNHGTRSKYIVRPNFVTNAGNHQVWKYVKGYKQMKMPEELAASHHYRICEFGGYDCLNKSSKIDTTAQRWGATLIPRIKLACQKIYKGQNCPKAPPLGSPW